MQDLLNVGNPSGPQEDSSDDMDMAVDGMVVSDACSCELRPHDAVISSCTKMVDRSTDMAPNSPSTALQSTITATCPG